jgi:hypothetical protein
MMALSPSGSGGAEAAMRVLLAAADGSQCSVKSHRLHALLFRFPTSTLLLWFNFAAIGSHGIELI